jgi:hypothetical protein
MCVQSWNQHVNINVKKVVVFVVATDADAAAARTLLTSEVLFADNVSSPFPPTLTYTHTHARVCT